MRYSCAMKDDTKLTHAGRPRGRGSHPVNPPVERASTYLFPTFDDYREGRRAITYGRLGGATHRALEDAITALEGGFETRLAPSGLAACAFSILAFVEAGDRVLITDSAYDPTRKFAQRFLKRFGVETVFYDPLIERDDLAALIDARTKVVFAESPGSLTFETQDLPMIADVAHRAGAVLIVDNTWSAGLYCKPIALGADVSIQAATKYLVGHADCLLGSMTSADESAAKAIYFTQLQLGSNVSADDAYLTLRGMRSLSARLARHQENALALAKWLAKRAEIEKVIHPAIKGAPGHAFWKRDFTGSSGLFSAILKPSPPAAIEAFFNALRLFGLGFSWGGYESLVMPADPAPHRSARPWNDKGQLVRFHAGLEDIDDLKADLANAFAMLGLAAQREEENA